MQTLGEVATNNTRLRKGIDKLINWIIWFQVARVLRGKNAEMRQVMLLHDDRNQTPVFRVEILCTVRRLNATEQKGLKLKPFEAENLL